MTAGAASSSIGPSSNDPALLGPSREATRVRRKRAFRYWNRLGVTDLDITVARCSVTGYLVPCHFRSSVWGGKTKHCVYWQCTIAV